MSHLVYALVNGSWMPQVVLENGTLTSPDARFIYSPLYSLNDGINNVYYFNESYLEGELMFTRVLFINTLPGAISKASQQYFTVGEVITYAPSFNPPKIEPGHFNVMISPSVIDLWIMYCDPSCSNMIDVWQWNSIHEAMILRQQNLSYQQSISKALETASEAIEALAKVQGKVEILESELKKQQALQIKKPKSKIKSPQKVAVKKQSQEEERKKSVDYAIAKFKVLSSMQPPAYLKIYQLFLNINPEDQASFVAELTISIELCHKLLLQDFAKQDSIKHTADSVKLCFLRKLASYNIDTHKAYVREHKNAHKIIEIARGIKKADTELLTKITNIYTSLQREIDKEHHEQYTKPLQLIHKALEACNFEEHQQLMQQHKLLQPNARDAFFDWLKKYKKAPQKDLQQFMRHFNITTEQCLQILEDVRYSAAIKFASLSMIAMLSPQDYYFANQKLNFIALYEKFGKEINHTDPELHKQLQAAQDSSKQWFDAKAQEILELLSAEAQPQLDCDLLPNFASYSNAAGQTVFMLAIKQQLPTQTLVAITKANGTKFAVDSHGQTALHYLAKYHQGDNLEILKFLDLTPELFMAQENVNGDTYLHYLIRFQSTSIITKFVKFLNDPTLAIITKNLNGETIATLLDDKDSEWHDLRNFLYSKIEAKHKSIEALKDYNGGFFTSNTRSYRLFQLAETNPGRLIQILNARVILQKNLAKSNPNAKVAEIFEIDDINKYCVDGHTLHWHLTEALMKKKSQSLDLKYSESDFLADCSQLELFDTLTFKKLRQIDFSNVKSAEQFIENPQPAALSVIQELVKFLQLHQETVDEFITLAAEHKLVLPLACTICMIRRLKTHEQLTREVNMSLFLLFTSDKIAVLEELLKFTPEQYNKFLTPTLITYYIKHEQYQSISWLASQYKYCKEEIISAISYEFSPQGTFSGEFLKFINKVREQQLTYLMLFLISFIDQQPPENNLNVIIAYLVRVTKTDEDLNLICCYINAVSPELPERKSYFLSTMVQLAAKKDNIGLLDKLYNTYDLVFNIRTLIIMAKNCEPTKEGIQFVFNQSIRRMALEKKEDQLKIFLDVHNSLAANNLPQHAALWVRLVEENIENQLEIIPQVLIELKQRHKVDTMVQTIRSKSSKPKLLG